MVNKIYKAITGAGCIAASAIAVWTLVFFLDTYIEDKEQEKYLKMQKKSMND